MVLLLLAAIWAAVLIPPMLRARSESRPAGSITDFRRQLRVLGRTGPSVLAPAHSLHRPDLTAARRIDYTVRPRRGSRAIKRRRDIFMGLLTVMGGSLVLGVLPPLRVLWVVHVIADVLFAAYVAALVYVRNLSAERETKVRFLPTASAPEPAFLLRRSAN